MEINLTKQQIKEIIKIKKQIRKSKNIIADEKDKLESLHFEALGLVKCGGTAEEYLITLIDEISILKKRKRHGPAKAC